MEKSSPSAPATPIHQYAVPESPGTSVGETPSASDHVTKNASKSHVRSSFTSKPSSRNNVKRRVNMPHLHVNPTAYFKRRPAHKLLESTGESDDGPRGWRFAGFLPSTKGR